MYVMGMPYCCGVDFLYGFIGTDTNWILKDYEKWLYDEIEHTRKYHINFKKGLEFIKSENHGIRPIKLLIINKRQNEIMQPILEKFNFILLTKEKNINSNNFIYFYLKVIFPEKKGIKNND